MAERRRTPTQEANGIAAAQIRAYLMAGQPSEDCGCDGCPRCTAVIAALDRLEERLWLKSGELKKQDGDHG